ncbi:MAG: DNA polymerase ligase N-terminal domain-containing protein [Candidatus Altiarchaeota archaeon]
MALEEYNGKRDPKKTTEPFDSSAGLKHPVYVIQEHHASHLHWDLRLEFDGVLRSWALPKEPPMEAGVKRLAVAVEDHPLSYATFEGRIPDGEYGAGQVRIWDRGTYELKEAKDGKISIGLKGDRLQGGYELIRTRMGGKEKNWLFFKKTG